MVKLFKVFNRSTVVLNLLAIEYKLSPFSTWYTLLSSSKEGTCNIFPICKILVSKLFNFLIVSTVVSNFFAILYKLSPFKTV